MNAENKTSIKSSLKELIIYIKPAIKKSLVNFFIGMMTYGIPWTVLLIIAFSIHSEVMVKLVQGIFAYIFLLTLAVLQIAGSYTTLLPLGRRGWVGGIFLWISFTVAILFLPVVALIYPSRHSGELISGAIQDPNTAFRILISIGFIVGFTQLLGGIIVTLRSLKTAS